ncbi:g-patch domain-containing protein [Hirsutella rhossiliensis]|uniref:G-patch domain-containing protein n=1 Tax=Hirsutella rhossiliensis TaxID=111463 RepID=A0A9P8N1V5_9HYPO|nr:g-patch domain-containing protein [Hirsutella rhossiliensis]KAH0963177.1 g-patch domain-containing protein [Hirsutella rhossiliensis]
MASRRGGKANVKPRNDVDDEEDDYMNMTFEDQAPEKESSVRRSERLKRESQARGYVKSKATLAKEEAAAREKALSKSLLDDPRSKKSKGLAMMAKMGFTGGGLGKGTDEGGGGSGRTEPIKVTVKENRGGIGLDSEKKRHLQDEAAARATKAPKMDPLEYRERASKENEEARLESQLLGAQRVVEGLEEAPASKSGRILKSIPIVYRGLVRAREEKQHNIRLRHELEQSLGRLPVIEDGEFDDDDKTALGLKHISYVTAEDLDDEDEELDAFNALGAADRLRKVVEYLRQEHHYCFWCKMAYPDERMGDCPGLAEEDHD